ncbi:MAG TPA: glycosyltransferase [Pyrinomonadaceae bacterium]|nr:glycosyltransferase [Pyrinomonadaceae bacterium]
MAMKKVSVIIPAYSAARFIGAALDSVFAQTYRDYEVVVVNDGSPDTPELEEVLKPYAGKIEYIVQENRGLSGARNSGIRAAHGEFVALLDADDIWEPNYLERQFQELERHPEFDIVYANAIIFGDSIDAGKKFMDLCPSDGPVTFESLVTQQCNVMVSVLARRETLIAAGLFDEQLRSVEDFDLWLRVIKQGGKIGYHRDVLTRYRRHGASLSADPVWMCQHVLKVLDKNAQTLSLAPEEKSLLERERARFHAMLLLQEGKRAFFKGDQDLAISKLTEANRIFRSKKISATLWSLRHMPRALLFAYDLRDKLILRASTKH